MVTNELFHPHAEPGIGQGPGWNIETALHRLHRRGLLRSNMPLPDRAIACQQIRDGRPAAQSRPRICE